MLKNRDLLRFYLFFDHRKGGDPPYIRLQEYKQSFNLLDKRNRNIRVLDIGTGKIGIFPKLILKYCKDCLVHGMDIQETSNILKNTRFSVEELNRLRLIRGDITKAPFRDASFDIITAVSTIEHLPGELDKKGIKEIPRIIKENGLFVMSVPYNKEYHEEYLPVNPYGIKYSQKLENNCKKQGEFFQKVHDNDSLKELFKNSSLNLEKVIILGDKIPIYDKILLPASRIKPPFLKIIIAGSLRIIQPLLSVMFYKRIYLNKKLQESEHSLYSMKDKVMILKMRKGVKQ